MGSNNSATTTRVLVVDDEQLIRKAWRVKLNDIEEFSVVDCETGMEALQILSTERVDVVVTDVMMPGISGLDLLRQIKRTRPEIEVIIMTGKGSIPDAVEATRNGAFDYITKPFNELEDCINKVRQAARLKSLRDENMALRQQVDSGPHSALLQSRSPTMKPVLVKINQVARVNSNVLITGPTGAGKGVIARAIHDRSDRRNGPFVHVDCGSIPSELIESELFGHVQGAFTGAVSNKSGLFEIADKGTILLDEIGNMPMAMQKRLLRVLQESVVRRVGGNKDIRVDVRVVSATNLHLHKAMDEQKFRSDLFFRLRVVQIDLPGLNDRREDIPRLAYHFLRQAGARIGKDIKSISPRAMETLEKHDWKGNVRELENVIEAAMVFETSEELTDKHMPPEMLDQSNTLMTYGPYMGQVDLELPLSEALGRAETAIRVTYLRGLMAKYRNVSAAARHAKVDRANFRRLLRRYNITDYPKGHVAQH